MSRSTEALAFSVGAEYVRRRWDGAAAGGATASMIDAVGAAFAAAIDDAVWMEPAVRRAARRKLDAVDALVAHPDWILQPPLLDQFYRDVTIDIDIFRSHVLSLSMTDCAIHGSSFQDTVEHRWLRRYSCATVKLRLEETTLLGPQKCNEFDSNGIHWNEVVVGHGVV